MAFIENTIEQSVVYEGPVFTVVKHKVDTISGEGYRDVVTHNGGAVILPIAEDGRIVMVRQYRKPIEQVILELPAGKLNEGEDPLEAASRELTEETGYRTSSIEHLLSFWPTPGYSNEVLEIYVARELKAGEASPDEDEDLEIALLKTEDLLKMIQDNQIKDSKTIIGITLAHMKGII